MKQTVCKLNFFEEHLNLQKMAIFITSYSWHLNWMASSSRISLFCVSGCAQSFSRSMGWVWDGIGWDDDP